jgi:hypothetical protein
MFLVVGEEADEGLTDGAGAHHVDDVHDGFPPRTALLLGLTLLAPPFRFPNS